MKRAKAMGKRRMIFGSLSTSKKFNSPAISDKARLLYLMMYPHSDDFGRMEAEPSAVKMIAVPGLDWTFKEIEICLSELSTGLLIEIYEVAGQRYQQIVAFDDHQTFARERVENYPPPLQQLNGSKTDLNSLKISKGKVSKVKISKDKDVPAYTDRFLTFWDKYCGPNKTANAKPACFNLWEGLPPQEQVEAIAKLPAYIANASEPKYIAKPSKYLSEKLWQADFNYKIKPQSKLTESGGIRPEDPSKYDNLPGVKS